MITIPYEEFFIWVSIFIAGSIFGFFIGTIATVISYKGK